MPQRVGNAHRRNHGGEAGGPMMCTRPAPGSLGGPVEANYTIDVR